MACKYARGGTKVKEDDQRADLPSSGLQDQISILIDKMIRNKYFGIVFTAIKMTSLVSDF